MIDTESTKSEDPFYTFSPPSSADSISSGSSGNPYSDVDRNELQIHQQVQGSPYAQESLRADIPDINFHCQWLNNSVIGSQLQNYSKFIDETEPPGEIRRFQPDNYRSHKAPSKRKRTVYSSTQLSILEETFMKKNYLNGPMRKLLSETLNVSEQHIKVWFQNRRMKKKRSEAQIENSALLCCNDSNGASDIFQPHTCNNSRSDYTLLLDQQKNQERDIFSAYDVCNDESNESNSRKFIQNNKSIISKSSQGFESRYDERQCRNSLVTLKSIQDTNVTTDINDYGKVFFNENSDESQNLGQCCNYNIPRVDSFSQIQLYHQNSGTTSANEVACKIEDNESFPVEWNIQNQRGGQHDVSQFYSSLQIQKYSEEQRVPFNPEYIANQLVNTNTYDYHTYGYYISQANPIFNQVYTLGEKNNSDSLWQINEEKSPRHNHPLNIDNFGISTTTASADLQSSAQPNYSLSNYR